MWTCTKKPCSATCDITGDAHVKTFDGKRYQMYGKCNYALVEHCHYGDISNKEFEVIAQNSECNEKTVYTSCIRSVLVHLLHSGTKIGLNSQYSQAEKRRIPTITIDGKTQKSVYASTYQVETVGSESILFQYQSSKLKIHWTGANVYITIGHSFENQTCGLCGTYNFNKQDDFHTRSDITETSVSAFTASWIDNDKEVIQDAGVCHAPKWETSERPCQIYSNKVAYADSSCAIISDPEGPFKECHTILPPSEYHEMCRDDACICDNCHCKIIAYYAKLCMDKQIPIDDWRSKTTQCRKKL